MFTLPNFVYRQLCLWNIHLGHLSQMPFIDFWENLLWVLCLFRMELCLVPLNGYSLRESAEFLFVVDPYIPPSCVRDLSLPLHLGTWPWEGGQGGAQSPPWGLGDLLLASGFSTPPVRLSSLDSWLCSQPTEGHCPGPGALAQLGGSSVIFDDHLGTPAACIIQIWLYISWSPNKCGLYLHLIFTRFFPSLWWKVRRSCIEFEKWTSRGLI